MYVPEHFSVSEIDSLYGLIRAQPLGMLITSGPDGLDANHLPFELEVGERAVLHGHVARNNPVWQDVADGSDVLVVFRAGDAYISPNWFPSKHELHKQVPTWNYKVVHVHGRISIKDDERYVRGVVARLTRTHEASQAKPWKMTDSAPEYIDAMLKAIVGVQVEITRVVGKYKLSQNKDKRDLESAGRELVAKGETAIGTAMLDCADQKTP
ncbi:FMN-binding negative transcriptional regulator [Achromobacter kerstersii]